MKRLVCWPPRVLNFMTSERRLVAEHPAAEVPSCVANQGMN